MATNEKGQAVFETTHMMRDATVFLFKGEPCGCPWCNEGELRAETCPHLGCNCGNRPEGLNDN